MFHGFRRQFEFPVSSAFNAFALVFLVDGPVVEVSNEINFRSIWSPLSEHPSSWCLMKSEIQMTCSEVLQRLFPVACQLV